MELRFKSAPSPDRPQTENVIEKSAPESQFISTLRKNVNAYFKENGISQKGNFTLASQTFSMFFIYLVPFILMLLIPMSWWVGLILTIIMGIGVAGVGMTVMHDALHGSFSKKEWLNKLFGGSMYLLGGNVNNWKMQHNVLHHTYTNIGGEDGDIDPRWPLRLSEVAPVKNPSLSIYTCVLLLRVNDHHKNY